MSVGMNTFNGYITGKIPHFRPFKIVRTKTYGALCLAVIQDNIGLQIKYGSKIPQIMCIMKRQNFDGQIMM